MYFQIGDSELGLEGDGKEAASRSDQPEWIGIGTVSKFSHSWIYSTVMSLTSALGKVPQLHANTYRPQMWRYFQWKILDQKLPELSPLHVGLHCCGRAYLQDSGSYAADETKNSNCIGSLHRSCRSDLWIIGRRAAVAIEQTIGLARQLGKETCSSLPALT